MKALIVAINILFLSIGAFAVEEIETLRHVIKDSAEYFSARSKESSSKLRGIIAITELGGHTKEELVLLANRRTQLQCEKDGYELLLKISDKFIKEDALSSSFILRSDLALKGDDLKSLFDYLVNPYLELINYKTDFLTAALNKKDFLENGAMPFFASEINIQEFCKRTADIKHFGEKNIDEVDLLVLPEAIRINDVARSKQKIIEREIEKARKAIKNSVRLK
ncbi:MAG: hypothetical protein CME70_04225 [Halobacteriovorax sp.]|nr:hypothetical protein [Halobacteriovorax sp.]|tara:strand:+ start:64087 stop:64755 length:669 start_codon:yes stop_codon:yes gene_type:complete